MAETGVTFFTLECSCGNALFGYQPDGQEFAFIFRSKFAAELKASDMDDEHGKHPSVVEATLSPV